DDIHFGPRQRAEAVARNHRAEDPCAPRLHAHRVDRAHDVLKDDRNLQATLRHVERTKLRAVSDTSHDQLVGTSGDSLEAELAASIGLGDSLARRIGIQRDEYLGHRPSTRIAHHARKETRCLLRERGVSPRQQANEQTRPPSRSIASGERATHSEHAEYEHRHVSALRKRRESSKCNAVPAIRSRVPSRLILRHRGGWYQCPYR